MSDVTTWDYGRSVSEVKTLVLKWSTLTVDLVDKLYKAREELDGRGGDRRSAAFSNVHNGTFENWSTYCKDIGQVVEASQEREGIRHSSKGRTRAGKNVQNRDDTKDAIFYKPRDND